MVRQVTEEEIDRYNQEERRDTGRTDFLAQLRAREPKGGKLTDRDLVNHLSNNM